MKYHNSEKELGLVVSSLGLHGVSPGFTWDCLDANVASGSPS